VGSAAVLDAVKRKIPSPRRESNHRTPIFQLVAIPTELSRLRIIKSVSIMTTNHLNRGVKPTPETSIT
jgi:hypothetical protein